MAKHLAQHEYDKFAPDSQIRTIVDGMGNSVSGLISLASAGFAQGIPSTPLAMRKNIIIFNSSATTVWLTKASGSSGIGIPLDSQEKFSVDSLSDVNLVPVFSGQTITYLEFS